MTDLFSLENGRLPNWYWQDLEPRAYNFIMIDPPWRFETYSDKGKEKSPDQHYDTMPLDEIRALPVRELARDDCFLWLWAINPMGYDCIKTMVEFWRFEYVTMGVWNKKTVNDKDHFGTGYFFRGSTEPVIIGKVGCPKVSSKSERSGFEGLVRENSRKPESAYKICERLSPFGRRADVFSRQSRPGWEAFGNEATKFDEAAA